MAVKKPAEVAARHASCEVPFAVVHHVAVWFLAQLPVVLVVLSQLAVVLAVLCEEALGPVAACFLVVAEGVPFLEVLGVLEVALLVALVLQRNHHHQLLLLNRRCRQARPGLPWAISRRPRFRSRLLLPSLSM